MPAALAELLVKVAAGLPAALEPDCVIGVKVEALPPEPDCGLDVKLIEAPLLEPDRGIDDRLEVASLEPVAAKGLMK